MTSEHITETAETINLATFLGGSFMTSEHVTETVETIDRSTVRGR